MQKPPVKIWAEKVIGAGEKVTILQPNHLDAQFLIDLDVEKKRANETLTKPGALNTHWDFFVVSSYGKILPDMVLDLPKKGVLNVHPSLLPLYRGASPVESAILADDKETGVTIMLMDEEMDHGPILNQEFVSFDEWPNKLEVEDKLAEVGGKMLARTIPLWMNGEIIEQDQDHKLATYTKKIAKSDGEISIDSTNKNERENFLKIQAYNPWPGAFFFIKHGDREIRVKITEATWDNENSKLEIRRVIPEGRKEISYDDFKKGFMQANSPTSTHHDHQT